MPSLALLLALLRSHSRFIHCSRSNILSYRCSSCTLHSHCEYVYFISMRTPPLIVRHSLRTVSATFNGCNTTFTCNAHAMDVMWCIECDKTHSTETTTTNRNSYTSPAHSQQHSHMPIVSTIENSITHCILSLWQSHLRNSQRNRLRIDIVYADNRNHMYSLCFNDRNFTNKTHANGIKIHAHDSLAFNYKISPPSFSTFEIAAQQMKATDVVDFRINESTCKNLQ